MNIDNQPTTWNQRLKERMSELEITQQQLANMIGMQRSSIGHYVLGYRHPCLSRITRLEKALKMPPGWLMYGGEIKEARKYSKTPDFSENLVPVLDLNDVFEYVKYGTLPGNCKFKPISIGNNMKKKDFYFYVRVSGDAMVSDSKPHLSMFDGELVLIKQQGTWGHGSFVAAKIGNTTKIRQFQMEGTDAYLQAINPKTPNIPLSDEIKILGVVVMKVTEYDEI